MMLVTMAVIAVAATAEVSTSFKSDHIKDRDSQR